MEGNMITLYTFGPAFGLPDPSPFVTKAEVLLKMAGLSYHTDTNGLQKAPKRKLPYIDDDGERIADSTFIRWHIEKKYGIDLDRAARHGLGFREDGGGPALLDARARAVGGRCQLRQGSETVLPQGAGAGAPGGRGAHPPQRARPPRRARHGAPFLRRDRRARHA